MREFLNTILFRNFRMNRLRQKFIHCISSAGLADEFLHLLLKVMKLAFVVDKDFHQNISNFTGRYTFETRQDGAKISAVFGNGKMRTHRGAEKDAHVTILFRNGKALMDYLLSPRPDIIGSILRQDVIVDGNLNYMYKFAFMSRHLQLAAMGNS